jgi:hypothetical protein
MIHELDPRELDTACGGNEFRHHGDQDGDFQGGGFPFFGPPGGMFAPFLGGMRNMAHTFEQIATNVMIGSIAIGQELGLFPTPQAPQPPVVQGPPAFLPLIQVAHIGPFILGPTAPVQAPTFAPPTFAPPTFAPPTFAPPTFAPMGQLSHFAPHAAAGTLQPSAAVAVPI